MIDHLLQLTKDVALLQSKLILLIGPPLSGKSRLLNELADRTQSTVVNVGIQLSPQLALLPQRQRSLQAASLLRDLSDKTAREGALLLDNIEVLFDSSLQLDPLEVLKRYAHARPTVAIWPGQVRDARLVYSEAGHPEFRDHGIDGFVPFDIEPRA